MPQFKIGKHQHLTSSRYIVSLSNNKSLVIFRLPQIAPHASNVQPSEGSKAWVYYAMEAECPHAGGPMSDAHIDIEDSAYVASCPWHAYDFNVETGQSSYGIKACTFPVRIQDDDVVLVYDDGDDVHVTHVEPVSEKVKYKHGPRAKVQDAEKSQIDARLGLEATICERCHQVLTTADPERKIELTTQLFADFATRESTESPMEIGGGTIDAPHEPPRENLTEVEPWKMPNPGRGGSVRSRITMLHALANIEQWAIDLAVDACLRFATFQTTATAICPAKALPRTFFYDWLKVANDEAKHFSLLRARLEEMGSHFGALPVHHGLWESATMTAHDLRARISVIALVHEARGLDINPLTIEKFRRAGDLESVDTLNIIHSDEITHVTTGHRWLTWICEQENTDPVQVFRANVQKYFKGALKGPFNADARQQAGMDKSYYENLGGSVAQAHVIAGG